jgi:phage regulator Rha-like protein
LYGAIDCYGCDISTFRIKKPQGRRRDTSKYSQNNSKYCGYKRNIKYILIFQKKQIRSFHMNRSAVCIFVGVLVGAAATYGVMKNKDKIIEKFEELEGKLKSKGMTAEKAKEVYQKVFDNVRASMDKIKEILHSKNIADMDKEQILKETEALKAKVDKLS